MQRHQPDDPSNGGEDNSETLVFRFVHVFPSIGLLIIAPTGRTIITEKGVKMSKIGAWLVSRALEETKNFNAEP